MTEKLVELDVFRPGPVSAKKQLPELQARLRIIAVECDKAAGKGNDEGASLIRETWRAIDLLTRLTLEGIGHKDWTSRGLRMRRLLASLRGEDTEET